MATEGGNIDFMFPTPPNLAAGSNAVYPCTFASSCPMGILLLLHPRTLALSHSHTIVTSVSFMTMRTHQLISQQFVVATF